MEQKFNLIIQPAVPIELRHKIIEFLDEEGYDLIGSGEYLDKTFCGISFVKKED